MNFLKRPFKRPFTQATLTAKQNQTSNENEVNNSFNESTNSSNVASETRQAFGVMWGTYKPGKKHKVWEDDGILCRNGRLLVLRDLSGKELDQEYGFNVNRPIVEGDIVRINGKECLIESVLDYNDYKSGRCFKSDFKCSVVFDSQSLDYTSKQQKFNSTLVRSRNSKFSTPFETEQTLEALKAMQAEPLIMPKLGYGGNERQVCVDQRITAFLRPHQRQGIEHIYQCMMGMKQFGQGCILADEMGLGKTLQCIACVYTLLQTGPLGKPVIQNVLVLTPSSLVKNWKKEFEKWIKNRKFNVYAIDGRKKHTISDFVRQRRGLYPILIVSYETFAKQYKRFGSFKFDMLVCDEAHRLKNAKTKIVQILMNEFEINRRVLLTGTPIQNDLQELYTLSNLTNPGCFGSYQEFRQNFENPILASRRADATPEEDELSENCLLKMSDILETFILRRYQNTLSDYLPTKIEHVVICKLSPLQSKIYETVLNGQNHELKSLQQFHEALTQLDEAIEVSNSSASFNHFLPYIAFLRKLCNHPLLVNEAYNETHYSLTDKSLIRQLAPIVNPVFSLTDQKVEQLGGKFDVLCRMLKVIYEYDQKVVVVSNFTQTLDLIGRHCVARGYATLRLDGATPAVDRQKIVDEFNSNISRYRVFLLSSKAGGCGLNLVGASSLILYDIDWNPANDAQAMARIWRDGQNKTARLYRLVTAGTIEERILQRQMSKQGLTSTIQTSRSKKSETHFSKEQLRDIFTLKLDTLSITHDLVGCECHKGKECEVEEESLREEDVEMEKQDNPLIFDSLADNFDELAEDERSSSPLLDLVTPSQQIQGVVSLDQESADNDFEFGFVDPESDEEAYFQEEQQLVENVQQTEKTTDSLIEPPIKRAKNQNNLDLLEEEGGVDLSSLKDWEHYAPPFDDLDSDKVLMMAIDSINFVFRHITNRAKENAGSVA